MEELVSRSRVIISVLPPSEALKLVQEVIQIWSFVSTNSSGNGAGHESRNPPIFIDANAISPSTTLQIATLFSSSPLSTPIPFLDGSIIGGPSSPTYDPKIYLSCSTENQWALTEVMQMLGGGKGLKLVELEGAGIGGASALKMSYAGLTKGSTGLAVDGAL